ncbi:unnamed protein product [Soboliphyme baturini]|uniref:FAD_binding_3 domain-containing protein n=1 Tax=Soboliphyme baturini TaxID=241478 RepID=A0A183IHZ5_9BILA|nr:unnamed protein product [Soboliphyme baturini]
MHVWEDNSKSLVRFENPRGDQYPMAYIIENPLMVAAFLQKIDQMPNITVKTGTNVKSYRLSSDTSEKAEVLLEDGSVISTDLLIGADGMNSLVRKSMNVRSIGWKYQQKSIVANLTLKPVDNPDNDTAWQKFLPTGSLALLPVSRCCHLLFVFSFKFIIISLLLSKTMSSLSWACDNPFADHLMGLPDKDFLDTVNDTLYNSTHQSSIINCAVDLLDLVQNKIFASPPVIIDVSKRFAIPLSLVHVTHYVVPRAVLIGDAAHRIHPLAGQGVNAGYGDVACLTETLENAVRCGSDIGSLSHLKHYETHRQRKVVPLMFACDWLYRLYGTSLFPVVLARSIGLTSVNNITPLKVCVECLYSRLIISKIFRNFLSKKLREKALYIHDLRSLFC